jgi:hypothetical protein
VGTGLPAPQFAGDKYGDLLPVQYTPISFADVINSRSAIFRLKAEVKLPDEATVTPTVGEGGKTSVQISPQVVIELPLSFRVDKVNSSDEYAFLDLKELLSDDQVDLFDRDSPDDQEELFEFMENINLAISYTNNLGMDGATLIVTTHSSEKRFPIFASGTINTALTRQDIEYSFMPELKLEILDPNGSTGSGGLLEVKRQEDDRPGFHISSMSVTAGMVIDKTYDF